MLRVTFHAGLRALADARAKDAVLGGLACDFTCGALDVGGAVDRLRKDLQAARDLLGGARGELLELLAERILSAHPPRAEGTGTVVVVLRRKDDLGMLRALAGRLAERSDVVAICAAPDPESPTGDFAVVAQRGASATFDCGAWLKSKAAATGGRGGGRPERAEGRLPKEAPLP
jgi:alanyl-tRNA synthetase